jgi:hypothetical protein
MPEGTAIPEDAVFTPPPGVDLTSPGPGVEYVFSADDGPSETDAEEEVELPKFDERYRRDFEGLLFIGKVSRQFQWLSHRFVIKTPNVDDLLEIGQLHKPYVGTVADIKAYQTLVIAATLVSVDGRPLPLPMSEDESSLQAKYEYIRRNWYPWTLDKLYEEYLILDSEVSAVHEALGKA